MKVNDDDDILPAVREAVADLAAGDIPFTQNGKLKRFSFPYVADQGGANRISRTSMRPYSSLTDITPYYSSIADELTCQRIRCWRLQRSI